MLTKTPINEILNPLVGGADFLCSNASEYAWNDLTVLPTNRRNEAFLLEDNMKICKLCNKLLDINMFYKGRRMKDGHLNYCKKCSMDRRRESDKKYYKKNKQLIKKCHARYYQLNKNRIIKRISKYFKNRIKFNPWLRTYMAIMSRCRYSKHQRYNSYKKLEVNITRKDLKELWFRDKAYEMKQPSIDRINNDKGYTKGNCRYLELLENAKLGSIIRWNNYKNKKGTLCV